MDDLKEHIGLVLTVVGVLFSGLMTCLGIIGKQFQDEMRNDREQRERTMAEFAKKFDKVEGYLESITEELFERMRKAEASLGNLWSEHRLMKDLGSCHLFKNHPEDKEHGIND